MNTETNWILRFVDDITKPLRAPTNAVEQLTTDIGHVAASFDDVEQATDAASKSAMSDLNKVSRELKDTETDVENLTKEFDDLEKEVEDTTKATKTVTGNFDDFGDILEAIPFVGAVAGLTAIKAGIKSITKESLKFIATPLGAALAALAVVGLAANAFVDYNNAAYEANSITQQITHTTDDLLNQNRLYAQSIEKTFGTDFKTTLTIARNQVKAFNVPYEEAFDVIENGLIRGGAANDEFLDSMREYPKLFAENGYSLQEFQRIINTGLDEGVYSDKLPDTIKEFGLSITEQTKASGDALRAAFGDKFTDELFKGVKDGSITPKQALQAIGKETERVGINAQQAQVLTADLFRGAGEDAGGFLAIIEMTNKALNDEVRELTDIEKYTRDVADANLELARAKDEALSSESMVEFSGNMSLMWTKIKTYWYEGVEYVSDLFSWWTEAIVTKSVQVMQTGAMIPQIFKEAFVDLKNEIFDLIGTFGQFGGIIDDILHFRFDAAKEGISNFKNDFKNELGDVGNVGTEVINKVKTVWDTTGGLVADNFESNRKGAKGASELEQQQKLLGTEFDPTSNNKYTTANDGATTKSGSGNGGNNITMNLDVVINFMVNDAHDILSRKDELIDAIVGPMNNRLKDGLIAASL